MAFLWELISVGFDVLISDLDVVWLNGHWQRWMTWADPAHPPVPEAALIAAADVLVTTDELDSKRDASGKVAGMGGHLELNTGVVYFRSTKGSLAMVQSWRKAMLAQKGRKDLTENVNDQSLFNQVVKGGEVQTSEYASWMEQLRAAGVRVPADAFSSMPSNVRRVHRSHSRHPPCLPSETCTAVPFTFGTLPIRPFTGGHTWFNQNVQGMEGHELPQNEPITVHFTFQFGDTGDYPHGKRQRAREAALWAVDPPEYARSAGKLWNRQLRLDAMKSRLRAVLESGRPLPGALIAMPSRSWAGTSPRASSWRSRGCRPPPSTRRPCTSASRSGRRSGTCSWTRRRGRRCVTCSASRRRPAASWCCPSSGATATATGASFSAAACR